MVNHYLQRWAKLALCIAINRLFSKVSCLPGVNNFPPGKTPPPVHKEAISLSPQTDRSLNT
jgi:hypothetical protein